jgi:glycerol-3-phosphate dehydrogenase
MFVLPWNRLTLIGTTDEDYEGPPEDVRPTGADVRYLLDSTNRLFPEARLTSDDVISAWAGLRPLISGVPGSEGEEVSREHVIREEMPGMLTIAGGKLTSHRSMGEEVVDRAQEALGPRAVAGDSTTAKEPLPGGDFADLEELGDSLEERAEPLGLDSWVCQRLARAYGTLAFDVIALAEERAELAGRIVADRPYVTAEVVYSVRNEMPVHVEDVAYRRTHVALETGDFEAAANRIAALMREELGWDRDRETAELKRVAAIREVNERFRGEMEAEEGR